MNATTEQFSKFSLGNYEAALRIAQITLDSTERLMKYNLDLSKQSLEENVRFARELSTTTDPQEVANRFKKLAGEALEKAVEGARGYYELLSQTQNEVTQLAEENMSGFNKSLISQVETMAKSAPAGSDVAVNAVKTTIAATAATINSVTKSAQQVAQFADSNVKTAGNATVDAIKSANKRASN